MRSKIFFWNFVGSLMSIINRLYSARYHRTHRIFNESEKQKMVIWLKINFPRDTRRLCCCTIASTIYGCNAMCHVEKI